MAGVEAVVEEAAAGVAVVEAHADGGGAGDEVAVRDDDVFAAEEGDAVVLYSDGVEQALYTPDGPGHPQAFAAAIGCCLQTTAVWHGDPKV